jgi:hypothetical protein
LAVFEGLRGEVVDVDEEIADLDVVGVGAGDEEGGGHLYG